MGSDNEAERLMAKLSHLLEMEGGPWKFGWPPHFTLEDVRCLPLDGEGQYKRCFVCEAAWSCHDVWECPDASHKNDLTCNGKTYWRRQRGES